MQLYCTYEVNADVLSLNEMVLKYYESNRNKLHPRAALVETCCWLNNQNETAATVTILEDFIK